MSSDGASTDFDEIIDILVDGGTQDYSASALPLSDVNIDQEEARPARPGREYDAFDIDLEPPDTCDSIMPCDEARTNPRLAINQLAVIDHVQREIGEWRDDNEQWSQATTKQEYLASGREHKIAPPARRGLLVCHNVGAGKSAIATGCAVAARRAWGETSVIFVGADKNVVRNYNNNMFPQDIRMVVRSLYGEEEAEELGGNTTGTEHVWTPGGKPLKVRMPWWDKSWNLAEAQGGVFSFGGTGIDELAPHPGRGGQSFIAMPLGTLVKAIKDGDGEIRRHWSRVDGDFTQDNHRKLQDRPIVLIIDEAPPGGAGRHRVRGARLRHPLQVPGERKVQQQHLHHPADVDTGLHPPAARAPVQARRPAGAAECVRGPGGGQSHALEHSAFHGRHERVRRLLDDTGRYVEVPRPGRRQYRQCGAGRAPQSVGSPVTHRPRSSVFHRARERHLRRIRALGSARLRG